VDYTLWKGRMKGGEREEGKERRRRGDASVGVYFQV
jgi:hypothetical protein